MADTSSPPWLSQALKVPVAALAFGLLYIVYLVIMSILGSQAEKINDINAKAQDIPVIKQDHIEMKNLLQQYIATQAEQSQETTDAVIQSCKVTAKAYRQNPDDCLPKKK